MNETISTGTPGDPGVLYIDPVHYTIFQTLVNTTLRQIGRTSSGWDGLPSWLFRKCSVELVTHLVNLFISHLSHAENKQHAFQHWTHVAYCERETTDSTVTAGQAQIMR